MRGLPISAVATCMRLLETPCPRWRVGAVLLMLSSRRRLRFRIQGPQAAHRSQVGRGFKRKWKRRCLRMRIRRRLRFIAAATSYNNLRILLARPSTHRRQRLCCSPRPAASIKFVKRGWKTVRLLQNSEQAFISVSPHVHSTRFFNASGGHYRRFSCAQPSLAAVVGGCDNRTARPAFQ